MKAAVEQQVGRRFKQHWMCLVGALGIMGCSGEAPSGGPQPSKPATGSNKSAPAAPEVSTQQVVQSVFTIGKNSRDPFFPRTTRLTEKETTGQTNIVAPFNIVSALQAGVQSAWGTGDSAVALVHNIILQPGRSAVVTIVHDGQEQKIRVYCREILPTGIVVEIPGRSEPILLRPRGAARPKN